MHEEYGLTVAQQLDDTQWIPEMTAKNYVLLSKDKRIRTTHREAVVAAAARVFLLPDQSMRGKDMAARYVGHRYRIAARSRKDGPHIYMVGPKKLEPFKLTTELAVPAGLGSPSR